MADRGTNIDLIFRNGLKDYEVMPPYDAWESISPAIRSNRRTFLTLRAASVIAVLLSIGAVPYILSLVISGSFKTPAITMNQESSPQGQYAGNSKQLRVVSAGRKTDSPDYIIPATEADYKLTADLSPSLAYPTFSFEREMRLDFSGSRTYRSLDINESPRNPSVTDVSIPLAADNIVAPEMKNRLSIGAMMIPSYYSSFYAGTNDAGKDLTKAESGAVSYSAGFTVAFDVNRRLNIQTGVYYSSVGQRIDGITSYSGFSEYSSSKGKKQFSIITSSGTINSGNRDIYLADNNTGARVLSLYTAEVFDPRKSDLLYLGSSLNQDFNYLEIPFILRYKVIDRRIDFKVLGGVSYNMLVGNTAYINADGAKYELGSTDGLSPITFSSSVGMGMEYNLSESFSLSVEPTFRYYLTPLGGAAGSSIHPYSFGLLSGLVFKF